MKLKSFFIFALILVLLSMVIPMIIFVVQLMDERFEDTWLGKMIAQM